MKKRCIYCNKEYDDDLTPLCPYCVEDSNVDNMDAKEIHRLHQNAHNHITIENDRFNSGMVFLVTGLILLIVGLIFFYLSFKYTASVAMRVFRPATVEFVTSCICLTISIIFLIQAIYKIVTSRKAKKFYNQVIKDSEIKK